MEVDFIASQKLISECAIISNKRDHTLVVVTT